MVRRAIEFVKRQKRQFLQQWSTHLSECLRFALRLITGTFVLKMALLLNRSPVAVCRWSNGISVRRLMLTCMVSLSAAAIADEGTPQHSPKLPASVPSTRSPSVLVLDQEVLTRPAMTEFMQGVRAEFLIPGSIAPEIFVETMDLSRLASPNADIANSADWLLEKYRGRSLDFLVAASSKSLQFLVSKRQQLSPDAWIIAIERSGEAIDSGGKIGRLLKLKNAASNTGTLDLALQLFPATKQVAFVATTFPHVASAKVSEARMRAEAQSRGLGFVSMMDQGLDQLQSSLKQLPRGTVVYYNGVHADKNGQRLVPAEVLEVLSQSSAHPVFTGLDTQIGCGAVGGMCVEVRDMGRRVSKMIRNCLEAGVETDQFIPEKAILDARALTRFQVPDERIPPGSEIRFQEMGFWETYWQQTLGGVLVLLIQAGLITALVFQLRQRRGAEQMIRVQTEKLEQASRLSTLGQYAASLAHELGQPLGAILNNVEAATLLLNKDPQSHIEELREIVHDIAEDDRRAGLVLDGIRQMVRRQQLTLRPMNLHSMLQSVMLLARPRLEAERIAVSILCELQQPMISGDEILLQQAILNLLNNSVDAIIAYAARLGSNGFVDTKANNIARERAGRGTVQLVVREALSVDQKDSEMRIELLVIDNGGGIDLSQESLVQEAFFTTRSTGLGIGLSIVQSIMDQHEGRMTLQNHPGAGLTVILNFRAIFQQSGTAEGATA